MIVQLCGHGGVGKLTVGHLLAERFGARLVDNHTILNPAFRSCEPYSPAFWAMVNEVRRLIFRQLAGNGDGGDGGDGRPIVMTVASGDLPGHRQWQGDIRKLADELEVPLMAVELQCHGPEHRKRLATPSRALLGKGTDPAMLDRGIVSPVLIDHADHRLVLDTTALQPADTAQRIAQWLADPGLRRQPLASG